MTAPDALDVHPGNRDELSAWDGTQGAYWAAHADHMEHVDRAVHHGVPRRGRHPTR